MGRQRAGSREGSGRNWLCVAKCRPYAGYAMVLLVVATAYTYLTTDGSRGESLFHVSEKGYLKDSRVAIEEHDMDSAAAAVAKPEQPPPPLSDVSDTPLEVRKEGSPPDMRQAAEAVGGSRESGAVGKLVTKGKTVTGGEGEAEVRQGTDSAGAEVGGKKAVYSLPRGGRKRRATTGAKSGVEVGATLPWNCKNVDGKVLCKPDVLLIGVPKCGTTTLSAWLQHHPAFVGIKSTSTFGKISETHMFESRASRNLEEYYRDVTSYVQQHGRVPRVVEYTANTIYWPKAIPNILRVYGKDMDKVKFLVLLRKPSSRIVSSYKMKVENRRETRTFPEAIRQGLKMLDTYEANIAAMRLKGVSHVDIWTGLSGRIHAAWKNNHNAYVHHVLKSAYVHQLRPWLEVFSRQQFHILQMEQMYGEPRANFQGICDFVGESLMSEDGRVGYASEDKLASVFNSHKRDASQFEHSPLFDTIPAKDAQEMRALEERFEPLQRDLIDLIGKLDNPVVSSGAASG